MADNPRIYLADFVDIVSSSGVAKSRKVYEIKHRPAYSPAQDFYKPLREAILEAHRNNRSMTEIRDVLKNVNDPKKLANYPDVIKKYIKWCALNATKFFEPPRASRTRHGIEVVINPELGLVIDGTRHVVKLYFKAEPITKNRVQLVAHLMHEALVNKVGAARMAVLDIRKAKLHSSTTFEPNITAALDAELAYVAALWPSL